MSRFILFGLIGVLLNITWHGPLTSQDQGTKAAAKRTNKVLIAEVNYLNGSRVFMELLQKEVEIETDFGKLKVPTDKITSIEFAFHITPEEKALIKKMLEQLADDVYKERETAYKKLVDLGPKAYPFLVRASESTNLEVSQRVAKAIEAIKAVTAERLLNRKERDLIRTDSFFIVGKLLTPSLKAKAEYFGEVEIKPEQVLTIVYSQASSQRQLVVDAAVYGSLSEKWMDTELQVFRGEKLTIKAEGQVDLWPQGPGQYMSPPDGRAGTLYPKYQAYGNKANVSGALIAKIGESGQPFFVGANYSEAASSAGKLYLNIVPSPWNNDSKGSYKVQISKGFQAE